MCVCVRVCERETQREKQRERLRKTVCVHLWDFSFVLSPGSRVNISLLKHSPPLLLSPPSFSPVTVSHSTGSLWP